MHFTKAQRNTNHDVVAEQSTDTALCHETSTAPWSSPSSIGKDACGIRDTWFQSIVKCTEETCVLSKTIEEKTIQKIGVTDGQKKTRIGKAYSSIIVDSVRFWNLKSNVENTHVKIASE